VVDRVLTSRSSIYYRHVDVSAEEAGREHFFTLGGGGIPATYLIGPDEKLLASFRGYRNESQLESFLESNGH
jgi:hypothetical protein